jgi:hypothetical protein
MNIFDTMLRGVMDVVGNHAPKVLAVPVALSLAEWGGNLLLAVSDGVITEEEFHSLASVASGMQAILLLVVMLALKWRK